MLRRGLILAAGAAAFIGCAKFDGHVEDLPPDVVEALDARSRETGAERERANRDSEEIVVGEIRILNQTVLPASDQLAPLLNNLHFVTQKDVIYDELDFKEGDKITRSRLYDAERYIRLLDPIKQARIVTKKNAESGKTDLTIVTQDNFSPQFRTGAEGTGGYSKFGAQIYDPSVFGRLYSWNVDYTRENFRDFVGAGVGKARVDGSRWQTGLATTLGFANSHYNYVGYGATVSHPFTRNGQAHGFNFTTSFVNGVNYDYLGGGIRKGYNTGNGQYFDLIYRTRIEDISAQYLYAIGRNDRIEFGPGVWHYIRQDNYIAAADQYTLAETPTLPVSAASRAFYQGQQYSTHAITFVVNTRNGNFVPMKNFQRYLFTEDQFEGFRTSTKVVHANPSLGLSDHYTAPTITVSYQKNSPDQRLRVESSASRTSTLWHAGVAYPTDDLWAIDVRGFYFLGWGSFAIRSFVSEGYHLTRDKRRSVSNQFTRGFYYGSVYSSAGHLTSFEYRSPGLKLPYLMVAGVVFFDYAGIGDFLNALTYSPIAGVGLRSMWHEFDNNVFRVDFGFNLNDSSFNLLNSLQFGLNHTF